MTHPDLFDTGGWRVHIDRSFQLYDSVGIWLARRRFVDGAPATHVVAPMELLMEPLEEGTMLPTGPSLRLPDSAGRALLDALTTYYHGGVGDARGLRQDYDAERGRVDKLLDHVMAVGRER